MARSRNIKPGFFDNEILGELSPLTRLLFIGLWCLADREGRLQDRPKRIKKELLGYDDVTADDVDQMLQKLNDNKFIIRYQAGNEHYIQVTNFLKHQNPHCKEQASVIPGPEQEPEKTDSNEEGLDVVEEPQENRRAEAGNCTGSPSVDQRPPVTVAESGENKGKKQCTVQAQCKHDKSIRKAGLIPDSLNLIPDSLKDLSCAGERAHEVSESADSNEEGLDVVEEPQENRRAEAGNCTGSPSVDQRPPVTFAENVKTEEAHGAGKRERAPDWDSAKSRLEISFCKFWDAYPKIRRTGKLACWRKWMTIKPDDGLLEKMLSTIRIFKQTRQWRDGYVPAPLTWLNQGRWDDECDEDSLSDRKNWNSPPKQPPQPKGKNRFNNFDQRDYDYAEIERRLLGAQIQSVVGDYGGEAGE